jgi:hypothetical protein
MRFRRHRRDQPLRLHPLQGLWRCRACAEPFDLFKCH